MATRSYNGTLRKMLLAAIASAHDDETAKNKAIVAAHRLETNQIPAEYFYKRKWSSIPDQVLEAIGVDVNSGGLGKLQGLKEIEDANH